MRASLQSEVADVFACAFTSEFTGSCHLAERTKTVFKVTVCGQNRAKQIFDEWNRVFRSFAPAGLCLHV